MNGKLIVNEEVFVDIAMASLRKVEDVIRQERKGAFSGITRLLSGKMDSKVSVEKTDVEDATATAGIVTFDLRLVLAYGVVIPEVAEKVREAVVEDVSTITGYTVEKVDIIVERLVQPDEFEEQEQ